MALQYGVFAANYPLTEDDLEAGRLPPRLEPFRAKLFALTIRPERLQQIRNERRPDSRYASRQQVLYRSEERRVGKEGGTGWLAEEDEENWIGSVLTGVNS